jgi:hypothetical protein
MKPMPSYFILLKISLCNQVISDVASSEILNGIVEVSI